MVVAVNLLAVKLDAAALWLAQSRQQLQNLRFAAARCAKDAHKLTLVGDVLNPEIEIVEQREFAVGGIETQVDIFQRENVRERCRYGDGGRNVLNWRGLCCRLLLRLLRFLRLRLRLGLRLC